MISEQEWRIIVTIVNESCHTENPQYRHDLNVSFTHLTERVILSTQALFKQAKEAFNASLRSQGKPPVSSVSLGLLQSTPALEEFYRPLRIAIENISSIWDSLIGIIRADSPTHTLLIVTDLLLVLCTFFDHSVQQSLLFDSS